MKIIVGIYLVLFSLSVFAARNMPSVTAFAQSATGTVVDMLRDTPAAVIGEFSVDKELQVYRTSMGPFNVGVKIEEKRPLSFSFSEQHLSVNTENAISITVAGIKVKVKSIYFHEQTGKFEVKTDTPLGIGESKLNSYVAQEIDRLYRPKITRAFNELKSIRSKQNLHDVKAVTDSVTRIFTEGTPVQEMPTVRGRVELVFTPSRDKNLKMDQWTAAIKAQDRISAGLGFVRQGNGTISINSAEFHSTKGIRVYGKTDYPEISSLNFSNFRLDGNGVNLNYDLGAEEVVAGFMITMQMILGDGNPNARVDCDPIRLEYIRKNIDSNLKREISSVIRNYRADLLKAGMSPQLLAAFQ